MGKGKPEGRHWVDGRWMTTREVAARVGVSVNALLAQKHNQGVSVPALVRMYDSGLIDAGRSRGQKYMVRGRWTTIGEEAARLGVTWKAINKWMHNHGQGGQKATLAEAVRYYEAVRDGREKRFKGGQAKSHWVNGRTMTIAEAAGRCRVDVRAFRAYLYYHGCSVQTAVRFYEARAKREAEKEIMRILGY